MYHIYCKRLCESVTPFWCLENGGDDRPFLRRGSYSSTPFTSLPPPTKKERIMSPVSGLGAKEKLRLSFMEWNVLYTVLIIIRVAQVWFLERFGEFGVKMRLVSA